MNRKQLPISCLILVAVLLALRAPAAAQADFGIESFSTTALNRDGSADLQAGSHPYEYIFSFTMNQDGEDVPEGNLRDLVADLPPGLVGNPQALPKCKTSEFEGQSSLCPGDSQIGLAYVSLVGFEHPLIQPVYNLTPPNGVLARLGFGLTSLNTFEEAGLNAANNYGVRISDPTVPSIPGTIEIQSVKQVIWGVPADPEHDAERTCLVEGKLHLGCASDAQPPVPFLSLPGACEGPLETTFRVDSVQEPGLFREATALSLDEAEEPTGLDGCNAIEFEPSISSQPTTNAADSPTGLDFNLHQPQSEDPEGLATAPLKNTTVTLPEGMSLNPSAANGLDACSEEEIGYQPSEGKIRFSEAPQSCPDAAKVGTLEANSPAIDHKVKGAVYVAQPYQNPFGTLLAIYLAVEDPRAGIVAKLAGKVSPDPNTGQLTTTFEESPQLPIEDIDLHFFGGARAALKTPLACGNYTTSSTLTPWSTPEGADAHPSDSFNISMAAGGSAACPGSEAAAPNAPSFSAGTVAPTAGAYSPFVLHLSREDGTQQITGIDTTMPPGLTGKLAGVSYCSEAQIAQAKSREEPNKGTLEEQSPSCPASSEVGTATVGAGAGPTPYYATGHAYLAGPYKGAPLSLVVITPAVAGPFDLGAVVVRAALNVDPETARIHAVSDPLPSIIEGIPLDIRSVALNLGRPDFTLNPTNCDPLSIAGSVATLPGQSAALSNPFQVGGCGALHFEPKLKLSLKGKTRRGGFPALRAVLTMPPGGANMAKAQVTLPHAEFIANAHIGSPCTRVQYGAGSCSPSSVIGSARVETPLLDQPLEGPIYLMSGFGHLLPDVAVDLGGQIHVFAHGRVDTGRGGGLRNTFEVVPDAPVSKITLQLLGGKKGLLENSEELCEKRQRAFAHFVGQNAAVFDSRPLLAVKGCEKQRHAKRNRRSHR